MVRDYLNVFFKDYLHTANDASVINEKAGVGSNISEQGYFSH